jgi:hypothetical protein
MVQDSAIQARKQELISEAQVTLRAIHAIAAEGVADPLTDAETLAKSVQLGILDAPQLGNNPYARGQVVTRMDERGACVAVNPQTGAYLDEAARLVTIL